MSAILVCCDKAKFRGGMYCEDHNPYPRNETAPGLRALLQEREKEIEQLTKAVDSYKDAFMDSQDKACVDHIEQVKELEAENKRLKEALILYMEALNVLLNK